MRNGEFRREDKEGLKLLARREGRSMATANSILIKDEPTSQNRARAAIEAYTSKSDERIAPSSDPVSHKRHLDVDAVLARSVRKVVSE